MEIRLPEERQYGAATVPVGLYLYNRDLRLQFGMQHQWTVYSRVRRIDVNIKREKELQMKAESFRNFTFVTSIR